MKQFLIYTVAILVLAAGVVGYRYLQQASPARAEAPVADIPQHPLVTEQAPVMASPGASESLPVAPVEEPVLDTAAETSPTGLPDVAEDADAVAPDNAVLLPQQTGSVQYTAPPNPGAASLGEFQKHFQDRLNSMPPEERDPAVLSERMQGEYNKSRSSLADAIRKSQAGK